MKYISECIRGQNYCHYLRSFHIKKKTVGPGQLCLFNHLFMDHFILNIKETKSRVVPCFADLEPRTKQI